MAEVEKALEQPVEAAREVAHGQPGPLARPWLAGVTIACALLFALDTYEVVTHLLLPFDLPVERWVQGMNWGPLVYPMELTNWLAGTKQLVLGFAVIVLLALVSRRAGWLMLIGMIASVLDQVIKASIARHRPVASLVEITDPSTGYSYPSGHAVFFTWLAFMTAAGLAPALSPWLRRLTWALAVLLVLVACTGRVWAGAHWPSDVMGGFLLALGWSAFVLWVPERFLPSPRAVWTRWRDRGHLVASSKRTSN